MRDLGFSWMAISWMLSVNIWTLYNHRTQLDLLDYGSFTNISNDDLDCLICGVLRQTPGSGETYITGSLRGRGIRVQRWWVRECLRVVDPVGRALRGRRAIQLRVYDVSVPNQVWCVYLLTVLINICIVLYSFIDITFIFSLLFWVATFLPPSTVYLTENDC